MPEDPLFVARMPDRAAAALADALADQGRPLPGVNGESAAGAAFAAAWQDRTGQPSAVDVGMRMYRLGELAPPTGVTGESRRALAGDTRWVAEWAAAFHDEAQPQAPSDDWSVWAARRIEAGELHLWIDGGAPVAMAAHSAAAGVARVGPVYTPPRLRRRGFGAAVTAAASAAALDAGAADVVLYTDLSNPTSNAIYQAIGYRPDHDAEERVFQPVGTTRQPARATPAGRNTVT